MFNYLNLKKDKQNEVSIRDINKMEFVDETLKV